MEPHHQHQQQHHKIRNTHYMLLETQPSVAESMFHSLLTTYSQAKNALNTIYGNIIDRPNNKNYYTFYTFSHLKHPLFYYKIENGLKLFSINKHNGNYI